MRKKPSSPDASAADLAAVSAGPDYREVAACACYHARRAARVVTQEFDAELAHVDLRATQYAVLCVLAGRPRGAPPPSMVQLAEELLVEPSALSRNLAVLTRRGLVELAPLGDRRQRGVSLTAAGKLLFRQAFPHWKRAQDRVAARLGAGRMSEALGVLRELSRGEPARGRSAS
ncbi:MAG TPA: MarR family winged helix-turn-helix transcriptional regulator [Polyangiaceae bacterium]|nr:MarR family winged helix-turn-helix transcriptional regulator [Polyangiaceae bacterium]